MQVETLWGYLRVGVLSTALALASFASLSLNPLEPVPVVQAGDDKDEADDEDDDGDAESEGREINGQVIGIYDPSSGWTKAPGTTFDETTPPGEWALRIGQIADLVI